MAEREVAIPKFEPGPIEVWSSMALTVLMIIVSIYVSWMSFSLGSAATFHITHGITSSWVGVVGTGISVLATLLAWRGFGLNAIAAYMGAASLSSAFLGSGSYGQTISIILAIGWVIAVIRLTRHYYEHNPFLTFVYLWGLTFVGSFTQSIFYRVLFDHSYPLKGVLLVKAFLFGLGGLTILFSFPRKNKEYVI